MINDELLEQLRVEYMRRYIYLCFKLDKDTRDFVKDKTLEDITRTWRQDYNIVVCIADDNWYCDILPAIKKCPLLNQKEQ